MNRLVEYRGFRAAFGVNEVIHGVDFYIGEHETFPHHPQGLSPAQDKVHPVHSLDVPLDPPEEPLFYGKIDPQVPDLGGKLRPLVRDGAFPPRPGIDQKPGIFLPGGGKDLLRGTRLHDEAVPHHRGPGGHTAYDIQIVGDKKHRHAQFFL